LSVQSLTAQRLPAGRPGRLSLGVVLFTAFVAWALTNIDQSVFGYAIPDIRREFGVDLAQVSMVISLSFMAGMILPIGIGVLTDRFGARWTLPLTLACSALLVGLQGLAGSFVVLALARILSSGLSAAISPIAVSMVSNAAPERWRAMGMAVLQSAYPLGWFGASLLVGPLLASGGWRMLFEVGFAVIPVALCLGFVIPKREPAVAVVASAAAAESGARPASTIRALLAPQYRRASIVSSLAFFFNSGSVAATAFFLPTFLHEVRGYDLTTAAHVVGSSYAISVLGYFGAVLVSMYLLSMRTTIVLWNLLAAALFLCMVWLPRNPFEDLVVFSITAIFFYGSTAVLITAAMNCFPDDMRTTAAAVCGTAFVSASTVVFPFVTAQLVKHVGWQVSFSCLVPTSLAISGIAMLFLPRPIHEREAALAPAAVLTPN
jgi:MFS family permease